VVFRETVDIGTRTRVFSLPIAAGPVVATLSFGGRQRLALSLFQGDASRPLAQVQGRSPLRVARTVPDGSIRLAVRGVRRASFVLTVSYAWGT
jgi:hypothetical protein